MFIRYNQGAQYYEYDTSAAQNGSGPWAILPLNGNISGSLPANVAYVDRRNLFFHLQEMRNDSTQYPGILLNAVDQPVDQRKLRIILANQELYFQSLNDAENAAPGQVRISRLGDMSLTGNVDAASWIRTAGAIYAAEARITNGVYCNGQTIQGPGNLLWFIDTGSNYHYRFFAYSNGNFYFEYCYDGGAVYNQPWACTPAGDMYFANMIYCNNIQFPNAQVASSGANFLDDYEEGSWAPTLLSNDGGQGTAYNIQNGKYTKIGQLVYTEFDVQIAAANWASGTLYIGGFPFVAAANSAAASGSLNYFLFSNGAVYYMNLSMNANSTLSALNYKNSLSNQVDGALSVASIGPGNRFVGSMTYRTNT